MYRTTAKLQIKIFTILSLSLINTFAAQAQWYNGDWMYRVKVTINAGQVTGTHTNFPLYFDLSDLSTTNFFSRVRSDGGDIRVTASDGLTELAREIVSIDSGSSTGEIHFLDTSLSSGESFFIYYNNPSAVDYAATDSFGTENVWTDYFAVWHMNEDPGAGDILDSSSSGHDATPEGAMTSADLIATGQIGRSLDLDNVNDRLNLGSGISGDFNLASFSFSAWDKRASNSPGDDFYFGKISGGPANQHLVFGYRSSSRFTIAFWGNDLDSSASHTTLGNWRHWYATYDVATNVQSLYLNGVFDISRVAPTDLSGTATYYIGGGAGATRFYHGELDEFRFSTQVRDANWISTEYNNQNNPSTFWSVGTEEPFFVSFTPPDNGTAASVTSNLEILFSDTPVPFDNGSVLIRRVTDDVIFQTLDTNDSTLFTVIDNGLSIRLPTPLSYNDNYYIEITPTAFHRYSGFTDNGFWNFYSGTMNADINFFEKTF